MTDMKQSSQHGLESAAASAGNVASTMMDKAGEVASTAGDEAKAIVQDTRFHAKRLVQESQQSLREQASTQATRLASTLREVGDQLTAMAASQSGGGVAVDVSRHLAETAAQAAKKLDGGVDATLADLKGFARRRPGLFLLGAIGAGFAAGRLIKAADSHAIIEAAKPDDGKPAVTPPLSFAPADQSNALALSAVGSADSRSEMS